MFGISWRLLEDGGNTVQNHQGGLEESGFFVFGENYEIEPKIIGSRSRFTEILKH
jgi:hypothetical protein